MSQTIESECEELKRRVSNLRNECKTLRMERDRANLAFVELQNLSRRALDATRDAHDGERVDLDKVVHTLHEWKHKYTEENGHDRTFIIGYQQALAEVRGLIRKG